jgi:NAD(P)-dependent dehydrogenase (short-subunit alcohol dehydrogenase family)
MTDNARSGPLAGSVAIVTGASRGLGRHFAATLASAGARVALWARDPGMLDAAATAIAAAGGMARAVVVDVTDRDAVALALNETRQLLGPVTLLVNNAGIARSGAAIDLAAEDWEAVLATNLTAPFHLAQMVARVMVADDRAGDRAIVNVTSVLGRTPLGGVAAYAAAKAGLDHLTRVLALEWARHGVRVNALAPGYVVTDLNRAYFDGEDGRKLIQTRVPMRRLLEPADLDAALLLLAGPGGRAITGVSLLVDGGFALT